MKNLTFIAFFWFPIMVICLIIQSCKKPNPPILITLPIKYVTGTTATSGGILTNQGTRPLMEVGLCWSKSTTPTIDDNKTNLNWLPLTDTIAYTITITSLSANTLYFLRAYATNSDGTGYGNEVSFTTTSGTEPLTDVDGNVYKTVTIGSQVWMAENLKVTKYNDGSIIPNITDSLEWSSYSMGAYCDYNNNPSNSETYGRLYNWFVIYDFDSEAKNVCPGGWHVPSYDEWVTLSDNSGGQSIAGDKLKETGTTHWVSCLYTNPTNETGFTALPGGLRLHIIDFIDLKHQACWWTSSEYERSVRSVHIYDLWSSISWETHGYYEGLSIRCIKD